MAYIDAAGNFVGSGSIVPGGSAPAGTPIISSTVTQNQQQAAALGITIPGVGGGANLPTPTAQTVTQNQQQAAAMGITIPGSTYVPPTAPPPITPSSITTTPSPLTVTTPTPSNPYPTATLPDFSLTDAQKPASDLTKSLQDLNNQLIGKSAYQTQENTLFGVDAAQKTLTDLGAQLTTLKNEAAAIPLQLQQGAADRGVTTPVLGAQENSRLRTNAIAALGVSSLMAAAQGQLANAQSLADKAVAQKYGPIEEAIKAGYANLQLIINSPEYTNSEKKLAFQQQQYLTQQANDIAQQKADYTNVLKISTEAASNIANFKPSTEYQTAAQALQAMGQATTPAQALQIAASVGLTTNAPTSQPTATIQEYNFAVQQGYKGTFTDYQTLQKQNTTGTWSAPYMLGGSYVQKNTVTGEVRQAVNPPNAPTVVDTGSALADAKAAIAKGADPEAVRTAFLSQHPTSAAAWDAYFTPSDTSKLSYPTATPTESTKPWWQFW